MVTITRLETSDPRMAKIVIHNGVVYLSGQVGMSSDNITDQTKETLAKIDTLLEKAGSTKSNILTAQIWLKDIAKDFDGMNAVWNEWIDPHNKPTRATVQATLARPNILVEIQVTAAATTWLG